MFFFYVYDSCCIERSVFVCFDNENLTQFGVYITMLPFEFAVGERISSIYDDERAIFTVTGTNEDRCFVQGNSLKNDSVIIKNGMTYTVRLVPKPECSGFLLLEKNGKYRNVCTGLEFEGKIESILEHLSGLSAIYIDYSSTTRTLMKKRFQSRNKRARMTSDEFHEEYVQKKLKKKELAPELQVANFFENPLLSCSCCKRIFFERNLKYLSLEYQELHLKEPQM